MNVPTIVTEIKDSVTKRKKRKCDIDSIIKYAHEHDTQPLLNMSNKYSVYEDKQPIRLLDEGAILFEDGSIRCNIKMGTIQRYYDSLPDDFVGYINIGHIDLWSMPLNIGTWTKEDLSIVEIENGRHALECTPHINKDLYIVKDLLAQEIPLSVSVEMFTDIDMEMTEELGFLCVDGINILGFSVVGNPANPSSSEITLANKGEQNLNLEQLKKFLFDDSAEEEVVEENTEETAENTEETVENTEETVETVENDTEDTAETTEDTVETASEEENTEKSEFSQEDNEILEKLTAKFEELQAENSELQTKNTELEQRLTEEVAKVEKLEQKLADAQEKSKLSADRIEQTFSNLEKLMKPKQPTQQMTSGWGSFEVKEKD